MSEELAGPRLEAVRAAAERIRDHVHRTPVVTSRTLDAMAGRSLFFKCENLQRIGAFKIRGATNFLRQLPAEVAARGVVTESSGNHGQAVALAARELGIEARVVMPRTAARVKREAVAGYGAEVLLCEPTAESRRETSRQIVAETGATLVHPFDHPWIIAGQATATLELVEQVPDLEAVVVPVGGGGLAAGACVVGRGVEPAVRIFAAEPKGADDAARSFASGELVRHHVPQTIADGLLTTLGELNWSILERDLEAVLTVDEGAIVCAMRAIWERTKLLIEPSAAVAVAAVLGDQFRALPGLTRVGVILSGGNVDLDSLPWQ